MRHVLDEIDARVSATRDFAERRGLLLRPPVLALGVSERVGSNWLSDLLRAAMTQHNEPLRQQIGAAHPLSALNPSVSDITNASLGALGRHWLVTFAVSKYSTSARHLVKETNLFFALPTLLRLFPKAPVVVLTRAPIGIASSFTRGGLWERWRYASRYAGLAAATRQTRFSRWAALIPDDDPDDVTALSRLIVLNAALLAHSLAGRGHVAFSYERHVLAPRLTRLRVAAALPELLAAPAPVVAGAVPARDGTFSTAGTKQELRAVLTVSQAAVVRSETALRLNVTARMAGDDVARTAAQWLAGNELYQLTRSSPLSRRESRTHLPPGEPAPRRYVHIAGVNVRNLLITNSEFTWMLNHLQAAGVANSYAGTHLLLTPMPHGRGGRVHTDSRGCWQVSSGYEDHPVYWVTWVGAAAYAALAGARLPAHAELVKATRSSLPTNTSYAAGDTVAVTEPGRGADEAHHLIGNVQVWCCDGPPTEGDQPVRRWLHGAAWNTPASRDEVDRLRSRHLLGSSRGVGIRLTQSRGQPPGLTVAELAARLRSWTRALADRERSLPDLDQAVVSALRLSQPDGGLGALVGPSAGET
jgi:formylglycine-generating enzyme required for sulfatase activity